MAHIRKQKNGTYQAVVYVGTSAELDKHGKHKKIYEYYTAPTHKEARAWARQLETDIENNAYSSFGKMRFEAWAEKWINVNFVDYSIPDILDKIKPKYKPSTQKSYNMYINYHFIPFFGHMFLKDITEMHIKEYIVKKQKTGYPQPR